MTTATKQRPPRLALAFRSGTESPPAAAHGDHHRRRMLAIIILSAALVLALGYAATRSPLVAVSRVQVTGAIHTPVDEVAAVGHLRHQRPMTDIDEGGSARAIERLPWVQRARVHRRWPRRVDVAIVERVPVASAPTADGWVLIDRDRRVLAPIPGPALDVPALADVPPAGPPGSRLDPVAGPAVVVAVAMPPPVLSRVAAVAVAGNGEVELRLRSGGVVRFGSADQAGPKFTTLETVLRQVDVRGIRVLDVRVPGSPVLTRQS